MWVQEKELAPTIIREIDADPDVSWKDTILKRFESYLRARSSEALVTITQAELCAIERGERFDKTRYGYQYCVAQANDLKRLADNCARGFLPPSMSPEAAECTLRIYQCSLGQVPTALH